ncbi:ATP-binding protein [Ideonella azotifigens]|nr:hybrid sensor histidine kinase/response regulator [Ideonella azotifigens]MCD2341970.1 ATP-binding protein [Ideonella azotifigens]
MPVLIKADPPPRAERGRMRWTWLVLGASGLLIASAWALGGLAIWRAHEDALADWQRSLSALCRLTSQHADQTIAAADAVLQRVVEEAERAQPADEAALRRLMGTPEAFAKLRQLQADLPQVDVISVALAGGELINFSRSFPPPQIQLGDRDYFAAHVADPRLKLYLSVPVQNRGNGSWTFYIARKVANPQGRMIGLALVGIESDYFGEFYRSINLGQREPTLTLLRPDGRVLARYPTSDALMGQPVPGVAQRLAAMPNAGGSTVTEVLRGPRPSNPSDTRLRIVSATMSPAYPLLVTITGSETLVLARWQESASWIGAFMLAATAALLALSAAVHRLLTRQALALGQLMVTQREANEARNAADDANRAKSAFLASMSHEIRTPLNGVLGMADLLLHTELTPRQREMAQAAYGSGELLLKLVNDVLDISKIEAGAVELEEIAMDLRGLINETLQVFGVQARRKGIELSGELSPDLPAAVLGDPVRLQQVLSNLLSNALKFTEAGQVRLAVRPLPGEQPGRILLQFRVQDSGIGIDPSALPRLFRPFSQADRSTTRRYGGTGLGLAIAQELVHLMGGRLEASSEPGRGSVFLATLPMTLAAISALPVALAETPASPAEQPRRFQGRRVLLAEDNAVNAMVARAMLEDLGFEVFEAANGRQAVEMALRHDHDLVLMDCLMPEMDGFEATRRLREAGLNDLLIIALTASAISGDMEQCIAVGMNAYLAKPVTRSALESMLDLWMPAAA